MKMQVGVDKVTEIITRWQRPWLMSTMLHKWTSYAVPMIGK